MTEGETSVLVSAAAAAVPSLSFATEAAGGLAERSKRKRLRSKVSGVEFLRRNGDDDNDDDGHRPRQHNTLSETHTYAVTAVPAAHKVTRATGGGGGFSHHSSFFSVRRTLTSEHQPANVTTSKRTDGSDQATKEANLLTSKSRKVSENLVQQRREPATHWFSARPAGNLISRLAPTSSSPLSLDTLLTLSSACNSCCPLCHSCCPAAGCCRFRRRFRRQVQRSLPTPDPM